MEKLTEQENIIMQQIVKGYNNTQISKSIFISVHTVKAHISSIFRKLGAKNRANAVYIALKNNIVDE